jgi:gliding motility-associated-like protein
MTTSQNGSYILTITDAKGCEKSNSFVVNVPAIGSADFRYNAFALTTYNFLSIKDPIQFTNLTTGDFTSLKWDFGDGSATTNEENPVHTYNSVGSFDVVLTVEFTQGCIAVFERTITITQGYSLMHPTAFTPNDDGYNETIRPSYRGFTNIRMTIYDTWGTTVYQEEGVNLKGWNGLINGKPAENGNYVMVVRGTTFYDKEIIKSSPVTLLK